MIRRASQRPLPVRAGRSARGLTLVEMLVAMSITLLIMAAVVTVFANISGSVTRRRATIEMASALRNVRETLARDLAGATCPAVPWQRPESNHGYLELIEGPQNDYYPTPFLFDATGDGVPDPIPNASNLPAIDLAVSSLPGSDLGGDPVRDIEGVGLAIGSNAPLEENTPTDGRGLGDADDILMLTVRNEQRPFVGRVPNRSRAPNPATPGATFDTWAFGSSGAYFEEVESPLAEVVWYAVENPVDPNRTFGFGEPGYRTIYRRALLILPEIDYGIHVNDAAVVSGTVADAVDAGPGVVRVFPHIVTRARVNLALAGLIAFQERFDLSVRLEWNPLLPNRSEPSNYGRWVLRANSLADLTKRENRYEHHGLVDQPQTVALRQQASTVGTDRYFPFAVASGGVHSSGNAFDVLFVPDRELGGVAATDFRAIATPATIASLSSATTVVAYEQQAGGNPGQYAARPLAYLNDGTDRPATARAILNEDGQVVHVTTGLAPLGGDRRGDDIMLTDALAFDLRVYDPGAPLYAYFPGGAAGERPDLYVQPGDPGWVRAYYRDVTANAIGDLTPGVSAAHPFRYERQGAYVDPGYGLQWIDPTANTQAFVSRFSPEVVGPIDINAYWDDASSRGLIRSLFFDDGLIRTATGPDSSRAKPEPLTRRFATYDTWSWHYESNGVNEDGDQPDGAVRSDAADPSAIDEGVNGFDDSTYYEGVGVAKTLGPDDYNERETRPPYDTALRGMQVTLRAYERDSRQIREVKVRESFVPQ